MALALRVEIWFARVYVYKYTDKNNLGYSILGYILGYIQCNVNVITQVHAN